MTRFILGLLAMASAAIALLLPRSSCGRAETGSLDSSRRRLPFSPATGWSKRASPPGTRASTICSLIRLLAFLFDHCWSCRQEPPPS